MRLVLMGPPGAGKGTQAQMLTERLGVGHLSSGDIFRAERASGSDLGEQLARYMDAGELVPDDVVVSMMAGAITAQAGGLMLDGFPRTVPQAEALDKQLAGADRPLEAVVVILADDDIIVTRITGRRSCPVCGKIFHQTNMPSSRGDLCDACEGDVELVQREDDTEAVVRQRLTAYRNQTQPVIDYYERSGATVLKFDGNGAAEALAQQIIDALQAIGARG
ncbi:MAG: adenylate kinase [Planctomycetota bacterium]|jgi:adenylate kinase